MPPNQIVTIKDRMGLENQSMSNYIIYMTRPYHKSRKRLIEEADRKKRKYSREFDLNLAVSICERIAEGETLTHICEDPAMPSRHTFREWVIRNPDLKKAYETAREMKAHSLFDETLDMVRRLTNEELSRDQVTAFRVALENLRWAAGKLNPQQYGERSNPSAVVAVQINTPLDLGQGQKTLGPATGDNLYHLKASVPLLESPGGSKGRIKAEPRQRGMGNVASTRRSKTPHSGDAE